MADVTQGRGCPDSVLRTNSSLKTLATAIHVSTDDLLKARPKLVPWRPPVGMKPQVSDADPVTLAVCSAAVGFDDEARWVRHVRAPGRHLFPYLPHQPRYNDRLRRLGPVMEGLFYCASHSRYFWGLRLHLVCCRNGLPIAYAVTGAKADERTVLADLIATTPALAGGAEPSYDTDNPLESMR